MHLFKLFTLSLSKLPCPGLDKVSQLVEKTFLILFNFFVIFFHFFVLVLLHVVNFVKVFLISFFFLESVGTCMERIFLSNNARNADQI